MSTTDLSLPYSLRILDARSDPGSDIANSANNGSFGGNSSDPIDQISWFANLVGSMSLGEAGGTEGMTVSTLLASFASGAAIFLAEFLLFMLLKGRLKKVYKPRTYLVPTNRRITPNPDGFLSWIVPIFSVGSTQIIQKCGLDAYFFLRYLRMLLKIFGVLCVVILPVLIPINFIGGRGTNKIPNGKGHYNVTGLDQLAWSNIRPENTNRYWAHLALAIVIVIVVCYIFFYELEFYVQTRQSYLTSPEHRMRASAKTVLVTSVPKEYLNPEKLKKLFSIFPGGVQQVWINRDFGDLNDKITERDKVAEELEIAETKLIIECNKKHKKNQKKSESSKDLLEDKKNQSDPPVDAALEEGDTDMGPGHSTGNPLQVVNKLEQVFDNTLNSKAVRRLAKQANRRHANKGPLKEESSLLVINEAAKDTNALWQKYLKPSQRETMRPPRWFETSWLSWLPSLGSKVDKIYYLRSKLAYLNWEIEENQKPEQLDNYTQLNSAFIRFTSQAAANMACQSVAHHIPNNMTPRMVEVSPNDVIWDNMSVGWLGRYTRNFLTIFAVVFVLVCWTAPVVLSTFVSQLQALSALHGLRWLKKLPDWAMSTIQGTLPALIVSVMMALLPMILRFIFTKKGIYTGAGVELTVQRYYFLFQFGQVFLVVTISSSIMNILRNITDLTKIPTLLADNIPRASNYFFSYMIVQALSMSAGALVQIGGLVNRYVLSPILDTTARQHWDRSLSLVEIKWGSFFPVYTCLASIGLIYAVIAPLIAVFSFISFSLFWFVYRYNTMYVIQCRVDTGGTLFPRAVNQLFVGLYFMEWVLTGLFLLVEGADGESTCTPQALIMIGVFGLTVKYQMALNKAFAPLFVYLPIDLEDNARGREEDYMHDSKASSHASSSTLPSISSSVDRRANSVIDNMYDLNHIKRTDSEMSSVSNPVDLEGQQHMKRNIFEDLQDQLEDLTPEQREVLIERAFQHRALRAKRPAIWIPEDDLGIAKDEVIQTKNMTNYIWIDSKNQKLNSKNKPIGLRPPDFSVDDIVQL